MGSLSFSRITRIAQMRPIATHVARSAVCVTPVSPATTAEPTKLPCEGQTCVGPGNNAMDGVYYTLTPPSEYDGSIGARLRYGPTYVKLLPPLVVVGPHCNA